MQLWMVVDNRAFRTG